MSKGRGHARHKRQRSRPNVLALESYHVECKGYWHDSPDSGKEFDCEYEPVFTCEECFVNGGRQDPRTGIKLGAETIWKLRYSGFAGLTSLLQEASGSPRARGLTSLAAYTESSELVLASGSTEDAGTVQGPDPTRKSLEMLAACVKAVLG